MAQTLYKFGVDPSDPTAKAITPVPIVTSTEVKIVWSSWCDLIYTTLNRDLTCSISYFGTSLNARQQLNLPTGPSRPGSANIRQSLSKTEGSLRFFGTAMHDGVRGYVADGMITVYGTPAEQAALGDQYCDVDSWRLPDPLHQSLADICMCSDSSLLVALGREQGGPRNNSSTGKGTRKDTQALESRPQMINCCTSIQELKDCCVGGWSSECLASFESIQLAVNATTATALDQNGKVHTRTIDPRYPACLGRPYTGTSVFEPVPYLSETRITQISSGGYMTAAISEDGELFLWGQANPGTEYNLGVMHGLDTNTEPAEGKGTLVWGESEQDEDVKCLNIQINGVEGSAYAVAVGFGHILVAARNERGDRVVLAAGCGDEGQLGLGKTCEFLPEFAEVTELRGKAITQLMATGWSSFMIVDESSNVCDETERAKKWHPNAPLASVGEIGHHQTDLKSAAQPTPWEGVFESTARFHDSLLNEFPSHGVEAEFQANRELTRPRAKNSHTGQLLEFGDADSCAWLNRNGFLLEFGMVLSLGAIASVPNCRAEDFSEVRIACDCARCIDLAGQQTFNKAQGSSQRPQVLSCYSSVTAGHRQSRNEFFGAQSDKMMEGRVLRGLLRREMIQSERGHSGGQGGPQVCDRADQASRKRKHAKKGKDDGDRDDHLASASLAATVRRREITAHVRTRCVSGTAQQPVASRVFTASCSGIERETQ
ncbi:hypothetical protein OPT61_g1442 [Boeremia exigua]|uniref:Uncharacterized protein n=1 Tax=Boeremia exigua TaxID=749465 RepID=A0ACC2IQ87_9PLEO|nr:hypothetical protein OPT61_g1442 [Boeremia exigua]